MEKAIMLIFHSDVGKKFGGGGGDSVAYLSSSRLHYTQNKFRSGNKENIFTLPSGCDVKRPVLLKKLNSRCENLVFIDCWFWDSSKKTRIQDFEELLERKKNNEGKDDAEKQSVYFNQQ